MALNLRSTADALKYLETLDKNKQARIWDRLDELVKSPFDIRLSKPLSVSTKRTSRVGDYRILFEVEEDNLIVANIGPRSNVYRKA